MEIYPDGEQIPDEKVADWFAPPPGVPERFARSTLVVGARGAGKTILLRYHKERHHGIAIRLPLGGILSPIQKQLALGVLAEDLPPAIRAAAEGKASSLVALALAERIFRRGLPVGRGVVGQCLPDQIAVALGGQGDIGEDELRRTKAQIAAMPPGEFTPLASTNALASFVTEIGELCGTAGEPLLLLLDKADLAPRACMPLVLSLLDQPETYTAVVAMRPGHGSPGLYANSEVPVPGDHYDIVHLGQRPRTPEWESVVVRAVQAQLGSLDALTSDAHALMLVLARDSVRIALEVAARYLQSAESGREKEFYLALEDEQRQLTGAAKSIMRPDHEDFLSFVSQTRAQVVRRFGRIPGPVTIRAKPVQTTLFGGENRMDRMISAGLREGVLCSAEDQPWVPGVSMDVFEIHPIVLWTPRSEFWRPSNCEVVELPLTTSEVFNSGGGPPAAPKLFVIYRWNIQESQRFRQDVETRLHVFQGLERVRVEDGHVFGGADWPQAIRERIKQSNAVVADVTHLRPDVAFEVGFAHGLKKPIIPVVESVAHIGKLPEWLGGIQTCEYGTDEGYRNLLSSIRGQLDYQRRSQAPKRWTPNPDSVVWYGLRGWNREEYAQFKAATDREAMSFKYLTETDPGQMVAEYASGSSLLVLSLDGTDQDEFAHYLAGLVVAKPRAGYRRLVERRVLILQDKRRTGLMSDSLGRCYPIVRGIRDRQHLVQEVKDYAAELQRFLGAENAAS